MSRRILRLPAVLDKTGDSKSTLRRKELVGEFPRRVRLGPNSVGWYEDEIDSYLEALPRKQLMGLPAHADDDDEARENVLTHRPRRRGRPRRSERQLEPVQGQT